MDHILKDNKDDTESPYRNLHLEEISISSNVENDIEESCSSKDRYSDDNSTDESYSLALSQQFNSKDDENYDDDNELYSSHEIFTSSISTSPFPCDPYESYDWES
ncbi:unnamed protein product [Rotaria sp. Silwood2]|nr:unnamed protein product [Rotaria sp. Silwood2]CAF3475538.1 unnamed protein product [Rotaria sp. Silwood2]CAF4422840.1 unnamed protein product [Rotaria sp. Silwood2]CAF4784289.1 unnamed protein product [Rotaria sp. Silwood2]